ncbi:MAG: helicase, partial [Clostridia bacterium]|nr:helicase [Clostridia bacterium]
MKNNQNGTFLRMDGPREQRSVPLHMTLKQIYDEVTARITSSETEWKEFLDFHSRLYKYSFESAALIYAQRPDATLVADMETWNKKVGRWVNTGAKSIRVFDSGEGESYSSPYPKTRYLFDIKDTNGNPETVPKLWNLNATTSQMVADRLNTYYLGEGVPLAIVIGIMAETKAITAYDELMNKFEEDLKGTSLQDLPYAGVEDCFRQALVNSIIYLVGKRCGIEADTFNEFDLSVIRHFKSKQLVARLGSGITRISQEILREIEGSIKQIIYEQRSVKKDESSSGIELYRERRDHVSRDSELQQQGSRRDTTGQIRADGTILPEGEPSSPVLISSDGGRADADHAHGERGSTQSSEHHHGANAEERPDTGPKQHLPELPAQDAVDGNSGGNNAKGDRVQTKIENLTDPTESQNSGSFFSGEKRYLSETEVIESVLQKGSYLVGGKSRIFEYLKSNPSTESFAKMLKNEYGIGGYAAPVSFGLHRIDYDAKGLRIEWLDDGGQHNLNINWNAAAQTIRSLAEEGRYIESMFLNHNRQQTLFDLIEHNSTDDKNSHDIKNNETELDDYKTIDDLVDEDSEEDSDFDANTHEVEKESVEVQDIEFKKVIPEKPIDYHYSIEDEIGLGGIKTKFKNNIEAIKTLKVIESENRRATSDEQKILVKYIGWGGIPQAFDPDASGWEKEYSELKELLTPEEYESARASTPNAHYTSPVVIEAIFKALDRFGFEKGNILEPSMGTGLFYSLLPEIMKNSKLYGVELDSISGRISKQLCQTADIRVQGFETVDYPDNFFDVAIGNVPFGDYKLHDKKYDKYNLNI